MLVPLALQRGGPRATDEKSNTKTTEEKKDKGKRPPITEEKTNKQRVKTQDQKWERSNKGCTVKGTNKKNKRNVSVSPLLISIYGVSVA